MSQDDGQHKMQELGCFWANSTGLAQPIEKSTAVLMKSPSCIDQKHEKNEGDEAEAEAELDKKRSRSRGISGATRRDKMISGQKRQDTQQSEHELHIRTERERRKKMRNMFATLHYLLPQLPSKADKSTIVDEAVSYIKTLQNTVQKLQKQKLERLQSSVLPFSSREAFKGSFNDLAIAASNRSGPSLSVPQFRTFSCNNVVLNICGDQAQFCLCSPKKPGVFTTICFVLEKHKIQLLSAHMSSDANRSIFMIQAQANNGASNQFPAQLFPIEEIFGQAATEIAMWLSQN